MAAASGSAFLQAKVYGCDRQDRSGTCQKTPAAASQALQACSSRLRVSPTSCQLGHDANAKIGYSSGLQSSSLCRGGPTGNSEARGDRNHNTISSGNSSNADLHEKSMDPSGSGIPGGTSNKVGTVVICGWLGSNKRYLKRYQDWWTANSWDPMVFLMPIRGALTLGTAAQELVEGLIMQLAEKQAAWQDPKEWRLLFHCFSNTGWYTFGAVIEGLLTKAATMMKHVVGSVVDSAPHAQPCAKVWASGFTSALLPRRDLTNEFRQNVHAWMECFFEQWLKGTAGLRLQQLAAVLQQYQTFPQLYIYSESDHVVPHTSVEAFMEGQSKLGRVVSGMRFQTSPHVDHFRSNTVAYTEGLKQFVADALALRDPRRPSPAVMTHLHPYIHMPIAA